MIDSLFWWTGFIVYVVGGLALFLLVLASLTHYVVNVFWKRMLEPSSLLEIQKKIKYYGDRNKAKLEIDDSKGNPNYHRYRHKIVWDKDDYE